MVRNRTLPFGHRFTMSLAEAVIRLTMKPLRLKRDIHGINEKVGGASGVDCRPWGMEPRTLVWDNDHSTVLSAIHSSPNESILPKLSEGGKSPEHRRQFFQTAGEQGCIIPVPLLVGLAKTA